MAVSANYATPVNVNGFSCKNCTDVDYAKKHIDPAHPKDGPYGINAPENSDRGLRSPAVTFGGSLAKVDSIAALPSAAFSPTRATASNLDIRV